MAPTQRMVQPQMPTVLREALLQTNGPSPRSAPAVVQVKGTRNLFPGKSDPGLSKHIAAGNSVPGAAEAGRGTRSHGILPPSRG